MDLGDMIRRTVDLDEDTRAALAKACEIKASALRELRDRLQRTYADRSRVSFNDVINTVDNAVAGYAAGSDPDYWTRDTD